MKPLTFSLKALSQDSNREMRDVITKRRIPVKTIQAIALTCLLLLPAVSFAAEQDATEIVQKADQHLRGNTSVVELTMKVVRPDWSREMTMKSWEKGRGQSLVLVTAPVRDKGITYLKRGNEVWNWIPAVDKVIKIPPSMMMQSWMGSDFTNDDLVKESSIVTDYKHKVVGDSTIEGRDCWEIEMIPKPEAAVVWSKVMIWISKANYLELKADYYDENNELVRVMNMFDVKEMGGRLIPTVMEVIPVDKTDHKTILTYLDVEYNVPIKDGFFSEQNMKRVR